MFAFGVLVWEVCTQQRPWTGQDLASAGMAILAGRRPDSLPGCELPEGPFADLARRAWSQSADERPTFEALLADLATEATPASRAAAMAAAAVQFAEQAAAAAAALESKLAGVEATVRRAGSVAASASVGMEQMQRPPPVDDWMRRGLVQVIATDCH